MDWIRDLDKNRIPEHIAVIMDGNGRWAKAQGKPRIYGHKKGVHAVRQVTEGGAEIGLKYLTLYAFSTENWNRPKLEINALMTLLVSTIDKELKTLQENNIRLRAIGDIEGLPAKSYQSLKRGMEETSENSGMQLVLALNYSSRWDLVNAMKQLTGKIKSGEIDEASLNHDTFASLLSTADFPDPGLLIRTSGELRLSNFLLWELAYTELYFTDIMWPDFNKDELYKALKAFQMRERRFGKISEQI